MKIKNLIFIGLTFMFAMMLGCGKGENYNPYSITEDNDPDLVLPDDDEAEEIAVMTTDHITFLSKVISEAYVVATLHPSLNGLTSGTFADTRTCPTLNLTDTGGGFPKTLTLTFSNCSPGATFDHTYNGTIEMEFKSALGTDSGGSDDFDMRITSTNFTINNEDMTKAFTLAMGSMTAGIDFDRATPNWSALGSGFGLEVEAISIASNGDVYAGGDFNNAAGVADADKIARWDGSTWSAVGGGLNRIVNSMVIASNGDLYVGGAFTNAGGVGTADRIARWDGSTWSALGSGLSNEVRAISIASNGDVYAGGKFQNAGGVSAADRIARWNGSTWSALGNGLNDIVNAITIASNGDVYAGGLFQNAGGVGAADRIARWNGSSWSALGSGLGANVREIVIASNGNLYVGGAFTDAGGVGAADRIACWNGSTWSALGSGLDNVVRVIKIASNGDIYAGGDFMNAGGIAAADGIALWDGSTWSAVGSGLNGSIQSIAIVSDIEIYVGGTFEDAGGVAEADKIARYSSSSYQYTLKSTLTVQESDHITIYPNGMTGKMFLNPDLNDDPALPNTFVDNEFHISIEDTQITGSIDNGATTINMCIDTDGDIILQPLMCGCPKQGIIRIKKTASGGSCSLSNLDDVFDFGYDDGCNNISNACDQYVRNTTAGTCHTLSSCGTP